jgi:hypothetical protein
MVHGTSGTPVKPHLKRVAVAILAGAVGLVVNYAMTRWAFPFAAGRIVTLPIAILLGPWTGVLASLIACSPFLTTGPFVAGISVRVATLTLEALVIGVSTRRGQSPILTGAFFWIAAASAFVLRPDWLGAASTMPALPLAFQSLLNAGNPSNAFANPPRVGLHATLLSKRATYTTYTKSATSKCEVL